MNQLNVRNVDESLWQEVKVRAANNGVPVGELLNRIIADWLADHREITREEARRRAERGCGILRDIPVDVSRRDIPADASLVDVLFQMRAEEVAREQQS
ncbi:MAG TPA: hypothetical protein VMW62_05815 [Chloroflexota bacterium]|nr:hypothetical protein [Chloroflexota bacterium]